jgi:4-methylaminobutanoate oxidase (formaldehyde-forming)
MLNRRGGIECDCTVTRLGADRFRIVTGTAFGSHDLGWLRAYLPDDGSVQLQDVTSTYACLGIWGPAARRIVGATTTDDLSTAAFPYLTAREISVGSVPCLAVQVTYVGELGWELYAPMEYGQRLWDTLWEAGVPHGLVAGGYRAIESLRLEKGYRAWSTDITPETTPYEAGLGFCVRLKKPDFLGKQALLAQRAAGVTTRLYCLVLADPLALALGGEPVRAAEQIVGRVTSGGYGYTVAQSIAYVYLPVAFARVGTAVAVEVFGQWIAGKVVEEPLWDPEQARVRQ